MLLNKAIFKAYDIRGIADKDLTDDIVEKIGLAIGTLSIRANENNFVVGQDGRISSNRISNALISGLKKSGCFVVDIGEVATPILYFATKITTAKSGVMITASHNPKEYNGFKIVISDNPVYGEKIQEIYNIIQKEDFIYKNGGINKADIYPSYLNSILKDVKLARPLKVVIDCGNGIAGKFAPEICKKLGCEVSELFCQIDGTFPNHHPNPSDINTLKSLRKEVLDKKADIGMAFDGDGDRIGIIDNKANVIFPDEIMILIVRDMFKQKSHSNNNFIYDIKCSKTIIDDTKKNGGNTIISRSGHSFIKEKIKKHSAVFAGEMSGHLFFNDRWHGFDDALYSAARILEIISKSKESIYNILKKQPKYFNTPEIIINFGSANKIKNIINSLSNNIPKDAILETIDGLKLNYDFGWGLIRASNTTCSLVLRFEGTTEENLAKIKIEFSNWFTKAGVQNELKQALTNK